MECKYKWFQSDPKEKEDESIFTIFKLQHSDLVHRLSSFVEKFDEQLSFHYKAIN